MSLFTNIGAPINFRGSRLFLRLSVSLLSTASVLLLLVAAEYGLRIRHPDYLAVISVDDMNYINTYSETLGWELQKNFRPSSLFKKRTTTNRMGYRGREYPHARLSGRTRVLIIGDSIAFGYGVGDEETFAALLDAGDIEVVNLATQGYGTDQELIQLQSRGLLFKPDVVVLNVCLSNDIYDNSATKCIYDGVYPKPYYTIDGERLILHGQHVRLSPLKRLAFLLSQKSILYNKLRRSARADLLRHRTEIAEKQRDTKQEPPAFSYELTARLIQRIGEVCQGAKTKLVVVLHPTPLLSGTIVDSAWLKTSPLLRGTLFVDMKEEYAQANVSPDRYRLIMMDRVGHLNPSGHKLAAEIIRRKLDDMGLIKRVAP